MSRNRTFRTGSGTQSWTVAGKGHHAGPGLSAGVHRLWAGLLGNVRRHAVAEAVAFRRTRLERVPAERTCPSGETLEQARMDALLEERSPLSVTVGGIPKTSRRPVPQPPPLTSLSSGGLASLSSAPVPGSLMTVWSIRGRRTGRSVTSTPL